MKTIDRFQFKKGQVSNFRMLSLEEYAEIMMAFPYKVNPKANTLWIPFDSSNRTATLNLNHQVNGFDENGYLTGENGNCCTPYLIMLVSPTWTDDTIKLLAEKMISNFNLKFDKHCPVRVVKASRIEQIIYLIINDKDLQ